MEGAGEGEEAQEKKTGEEKAVDEFPRAMNQPIAFWFQILHQK